MRNLKKILALVLALMMTLSLMVTASADFTDQDDIQYQEAVAVMTGLGILNGVGDGSFAPTRTLTRAEAAKIIAYMLETKAVGDTMQATVAPFEDVPGGQWYSGPILYCANAGIIAGVGNGRFEPFWNVNGYSFGKMVLLAAGIGDEADYTGDAWAINVAGALTKNGIIAGMGLTLSDDLTREQACQMAWKAMQISTNGAATVYIVDGIEFSSASEAYFYSLAVSQPVTVKSGSIASRVYNLQQTLGVIIGNQGTGLKVTQIAPITTNPANGKVASLGTPANWNTETGLDAIGHVVTVYHDGKGTVYNVLDESTVVTVSQAISADPTKFAATFGGNATVAAAGYEFTNYVGSTTVSGVSAGNAAIGTYVLYGNEIVSLVKPATGVGVVSKVTAYTAPTATANGSITIYNVAADGTYGSAAAITLNKLGSTTPDAVTLYDGIADGDYVYTTKIGSNPMVVTKANVVSPVTITSFNGTTHKATVGGTSYDVVGTPNASETANSATQTNLGLTAVGTGSVSGSNLYNVVLTSTGAVLGYTTYTPESQANSYAVIQGINVKSATDNGGAAWAGGSITPATAQVKLALADGTSVVFNVRMTDAQRTNTSLSDSDLKTALIGKDTDADNVNDTALSEGDVVRYAATGNEITEIVDAGAVSGTAVTKGSVVVTGMSGKYLTTDTVFIYWDTSDTTDYQVDRFVGYGNMKTATATVKAVVDSNNRVVFAYVDAAGSTSTSTTTLAYVPSMAATTRWDPAAGKTVYDYTVYVDGQAVTLTAESSISASGTPGNPNIATYTVTDGYLTNVTYIAAGTAADKYVQGNIVYVAGTTAVVGSTEYNVADAKAFIVAANGAVSATSVAVSPASGYQTYLVIKTAAGANPAVISYVYYIEGAAAPHSHSWKGAWESNDTHHWHDCATAGCTAATTEKDSYGTHSWAKGDTAGELKCSTCEKTKACDHSGNQNDYDKTPAGGGDPTGTMTCSVCDGTIECPHTGFSSGQTCTTCGVTLD